MFLFSFHIDSSAARSLITQLLLFSVLGLDMFRIGFRFFCYLPPRPPCLLPPQLSATEINGSFNFKTNKNKTVNKQKKRNDFRKMPLVNLPAVN